MKVAAIQLNSDEDVSKNFSKIEIFLERAAAARAELALLPENFAFFGREEVKLKLAPTLVTEVENFLRSAAIRHKMLVVGGGYPAPSEDEEKAFNRMSVFSPAGQVLFRYDKIHLFDVEAGGIYYRESAATVAGKSPPGTFGVAGFKVTAAICYDLRFPEIFRYHEVDVLLLPAAFTRVTGEAHWEVLLRARAIENQCYVIAAAQWGEHFGGRQTYGHSMIIDPWGSVVTQLSEGEGLLVAELSKEALVNIRTKLPALQHRRF